MSFHPANGEKLSVYDAKADTWFYFTRKVLQCRCITFVSLNEYGFAKNRLQNVITGNRV
jgi:hypothetical protein